MMKKSLLLLLMFALIFTFAACSSDPEPAPEPEAGGEGAELDDSWTKIEQQGYFVLGLDDSFPPMGFRDESNEIVGFDIDMAHAVAEYLGIEVQLKPVIWDTVIFSLNSGEIDVIWNGMSVTEKRLLEINVSDAYMNSDQIIVLPQGSDLATKADLAGKQVGTQMGSASMVALEAEPEVMNSFELHQYATFTEAMMDLDNGRLDAVVIDSIAFYGDFNVKNPGAYAVMSEDFGSEDFAIGVRKTVNAWREKLNEAMQHVKDNGTAAEISIKWFGEDIVI